MEEGPLFEIKNATVRWGDATVLDQLSLSIRQGEKVIIRGPSGSGKSTILRLLLGFTQPTEGEIRFGGVRLDPAEAWKLRREVAYVNQAPNPGLQTAEEALGILSGLKACKRQPEACEIAEALRVFGLSPAILPQSGSSLSGGEKQRLALAGALLLERPIFVLDEPTASLDEANKRRVADFFLGQCQEQTAVIVTHDEVWRRPQAATIIELNGRS